MAYDLWAQDNFTKGELSPFMYARASINAYYNGLRTAQNVLTYPTGAAGKRFGTLYQATVSNLASASQAYFEIFQYLDECVYQLIFTPGNLYIYLEGILVFTVSNSLTDSNIGSINSTTLQNIFRITGNGFVPMDLTRELSTTHDIDSFSANILSVTPATFATGAVLPVYFKNTSGDFITTTPQIIPNVTYFAWGISSTTATIYLTAYDAKFQQNPITLTTVGGVNTVNVLNSWSLSATVFKNLPYYDFNGATISYDNLTFTPGATSGASVTITVSGAYAPLDSSYVGGAFIGGGGSSRITAVASTTSFTVAVQKPFSSTSAIQGSLVLLAEPAWSTARGWPQICSSYQNRALFANTASLTNGFWASVINDYADFGDLTTDDDDAISWFPSSNQVNSIRFIVPYRSVTVHTNTGIYSSPLSEVNAITPTSFSLQLQDSIPADVVIPQAIDNQIIIISGNDVHTQLWDGINNAYTGDIVSVMNEQTIRSPVDEAAFADLTRAGSRYVFIVNDNGSMAVFQTLIQQEVSGFTPQIMEQSYGSAYFRQCASSSTGRAWFLVERQFSSQQSGISITGHTSSTLTAVASGFSTTEPTAITFTTTGSLPTASPALNTTSYFWAIGVTNDTFKVYTSQADAIDGTNALSFSTTGTNSNVVPWILGTIFTLEELTKEVFLDCAVYFNNNGSPTSTITTGTLFNAQEVKMKGDGFGFDAIGFNNQVTFSAHGSAVNVNEGYIGYPINTIMEPLALTVSLTGNPKNTTLTKPKHIRTVRFMFKDTIGGTINDVPIALNSFSMANIGSAPSPATGIVELAVLSGWDDFNNPTYTIEHNEPFDIQLLGVFYSLEF